MEQETLFHVGAVIIEAAVLLRLSFLILNWWVGVEIVDAN